MFLETADLHSDCYFKVYVVRNFTSVYYFLYKWYFYGVVLVRTLKVFYYCVHKNQDTKSEDMFLLGLL